MGQPDMSALLCLSLLAVRGLSAATAEQQDAAAAATRRPSEAADLHKKSVTLPSGVEMPIVGLGTYRAMIPPTLEKIVDAALKAGYRHIEASGLYNNERYIGRVIAKWITSGKLKREDLFISSKLPLYAMRAADVPESLNRTLEALQTTYLDLYLVHFPVGTMKHPYDLMTGTFKENLFENSTDHIAIWKAMEEQVAAGRVRAIGLSHFNEQQVRRILSAAAVPPANLQVELHLYLQQGPLVRFCREHNITVSAYAPLGSPGGKYLFQNDSVNCRQAAALGEKEVQRIAKQHNKTAAQVLLRHTVQRGIVVIPQTTELKHVRQNIDIFDFTLDDYEMQQLDDLDGGERSRLFTMKFIPRIGDHPEYPWK